MNFKIVISRCIIFNVWGLANFVYFVKEKKTFFSNVLNRNKTKNSLGINKSHCMGQTTKNEK
jgi:hypothetical protein